MVQSSLVKDITCLLDTDIVIDFLRRREYAQKLVKKWAEEGLLAVSTITHLEIYRGMRTGEEDATTGFLDGLISVPVDVAVARRAGTMLRRLRSRGVTISPADSIIAATALQLGTSLLTNNVTHYPFENLKVIQGSYT